MLNPTTGYQLLYSGMGGFDQFLYLHHRITISGFQNLGCKFMQLGAVFNGNDLKGLSCGGADKFHFFSELLQLWVFMNHPTESYIFGGWWWWFRGFGGFWPGWCYCRG